MTTDSTIDSEDRVQVYLAGPLSDGENEYVWHEMVEELDSSIEWINPFTIHAEGATEMEIYHGDCHAVRDSDAVLLRRMGDYEVCGAYIEAGIAGEHDIPVVVWNDADYDVSEFLRWHAHSVHENVEDAIDMVKDVINS